MIKINEMWNKYYPLINNLPNIPADIISAEYEEQYKALIIVDRKLRPNGPKSKVPAVFTINMVITHCNTLFHMFLLHSLELQLRMFCHA